MHARPPNTRRSASDSPFRSRISSVMLSMFAGRLWQDAENRVYLIKELDRRTAQGQSTVSVDETLKLITCREQQKKLSAAEMELAAARQQGFLSKHLQNENRDPSKKLLAVVGILTTFGQKSKRDAIRKAWVKTGADLKRVEKEKGIVIRFVMGRSANRGDSLDKEIDSENRQNNDFFILDGEVEAPEEGSRKTRSFFVRAVDRWDAEFYVKVNDNVNINIDGLKALLATHLDKPRIYMGCMKSGEVFSDSSHKWYEPDWWKFGDGKSYFRHASGDIFVISRALAQFVSINRSILRTYAHDDVSVGSWFIGLDVKHIDERKLCCAWSSGEICSAV